MNKSIKAIVALLLSTLTLASFSACSVDNKIVETASISVAANKLKETIKDDEKANAAAEVKISEEKVESDNEYVAVGIKFPVISGLKDKDLETKLNATFKDNALKFKKNIEDMAKADFEATKKDKEIVFRKYEVNTEYTVRYNKNNILSITMIYYQYTGGAHGGSNQVAYNIDLKTGKTLLLPDIFEEGFDYKNVIINEIVKAIEEKKEDYFDYSVNVVKAIDENKSYYIENGNIVVYFGQYEIAPYAAGIPEFKIPFSKLKFKKGLGIN